MQYTYTVTFKAGSNEPRLITASIQKVIAVTENSPHEFLITVQDGLATKTSNYFNDLTIFKRWANEKGILTRAWSIKEDLHELEEPTLAPVKDHVNPSHYQEYFVSETETLQWLEAQQYLPSFRNPERLKAAVELQARKYLDRLGGKDEEAQEIMKSVWYLKFLAAYIKNGNKPIRVKNIDSILKG